MGRFFVRAGESSRGTAKTPPLQSGANAAIFAPPKTAAARRVYRRAARRHGACGVEGLEREGEGVDLRDVLWEGVAVGGGLQEGVGFELLG